MASFAPSNTRAARRLHRLWSYGDALTPARWPWPLPALVGWCLAWALCLALRALQAPATLALVLALLAIVPLVRSQSGWRRAIVAAGFPLSALATGWVDSMPAWAWLVALALLLGLYPLRAWSDAPWFPTARGSLDGLERVLAPAPQRVLDAGCGLGHGLSALRRAWPGARIEGVEWSRPLAWWTMRRCRWASVRRGDLWAESWADFDLVYLFQRPETMARAWAKAKAEMRPGRWLVSLEFEVPGVAPTARLHGSGRCDVLAYRVGAAPTAGAAKEASTGGRAGR